MANPCEPSGPDTPRYVYRLRGWPADHHDRGRPEYSHQRHGNTLPRGDSDGGQFAYAYDVEALLAEAVQAAVRGW